MSKKYFFIAPFFIAAAAVAGSSGCRNRGRSSRFYGAIEALVYDPEKNSSCKDQRLCPVKYFKKVLCRINYFKAVDKIDRWLKRKLFSFSWGTILARVADIKFCCCIKLSIKPLPLSIHLHINQGSHFKNT